MRKSNFIRTGTVTILFLLMISIKFSTGNSFPSLIKDIEYETLTTQDVDSIIDEFRLSPDSEVENQYLIYFDQTSEFNDFLKKHTVKMVFKGLEGVIIQTTPSILSDLIGESSYLTTNNVHCISNIPRRMVTRTEKISSAAPTQAIQSVSSAKAIGVEKLWGLGYKGQGITIGIFDEGVSSTHEDFFFPNGTSRIKYRKGFVNTTYGNEEDFEPTGGIHGTNVAGYAAGGGISISSNKGMAPEAWILDADLDEGSDSELDMTTLGEIAAIDWAIECGVNVINRSYGPDNPEEAYWTLQLDPLEQVVQATIRQGIKKGVIFVHSAGNSGGPRIGGYAIDCLNTLEEISVGATNENFDFKASYSSVGPVWGTNAIGPDVVAPGSNVPTTSLSGGYDTSNIQGTSFSAPHVAGAVAVLLGAMRYNNIDVNPGSIKASMMATTNDSWDEPFFYGTGQINASAAYEYLMNAPKFSNHPIVVATNPKNITTWVPGNWPFQKALVGSENLIHFTFVSSESKNVSMSITGNVSSLITIKEVRLENFSSGLRYNDLILVDDKLSDAYSHHLIFDIKIPDGTSPGLYEGNINFRVNDTLIKDIPYAFNVESSNKKILFYTGASLNFKHNTIFGEFVNLHSTLSEQSIVLNEYKGFVSPDILEDYDLLWMASCNQSYTGYLYEPQVEEITYVERERIINETMLATIKQFVANGGGLVVTPYSNPVGLENLIASWGITTKEIDPTGGDGIISHFGPIGSTSEESIDFSGPIFTTKVPAIPLAYFNTCDNVIMASYDYPSGGRVVVVSGSEFMTNDKLEDDSNPLIIRDILDWLDYDHQLFGTYELADNIILFALHTSTNNTENNTGGIVGTYTNLVSDNVIDITNKVPTTGTDGWFNFTYTIEPESIPLFNFSWNDDFVVFDIISDFTPPVIGLTGMVNHSNLNWLTEIYFWFDDTGSGINRYNAEMTMDGVTIGFNTVKVNKTGSGFYIKMTLYPENLDEGTHVLTLKVYDNASNSATLTLVFTVGEESETATGTSGTTGFEHGILFGIVILGLIITQRTKKKK